MLLGDAFSLGGRGDDAGLQRERLLPQAFLAQPRRPTGVAAIGFAALGVLDGTPPFAFGSARFGGPQFRVFLRRHMPPTQTARHAL